MSVLGCAGFTYKYILPVQQEREGFIKQREMLERENHELSRQKTEWRSNIFDFNNDIEYREWTARTKELLRNKEVVFEFKDKNAK